MTVRALAAVACVAVALTIPLRLAAQDSLESARQLYASAEYKGALTMLDALVKTNPISPERQTIDLYRTFCLVALGSMNEASAAVDAMITRDPLYHPNLDDVPPRLRTLFRDARRKLLPGIIQQRYLAAKGAFDRGENKIATEGFTQVLIALADPDIAQAAAQPPLADLKVLASGFNDLTIRALAAPPAPPAAPPASAAGNPAVPPFSGGSSSGSAAAAPPRAVEVYTKDSAGIVEPVVVRQELPPYPGRIIAAKSGVLDVVIDETGAVEAATIVESVDPVYNRIVVGAAKTWVYRPARRDGAPVKFRKRIQIALAPRS